MAGRGGRASAPPDPPPPRQECCGKGWLGRMDYSSSVAHVYAAMLRNVQRPPSRPTITIVYKLQIADAAPPTLVWVDPESKAHIHGMIRILLQPGMDEKQIREDPHPGSKSRIQIPQPRLGGKHISRKEAASSSRKACCQEPGRNQDPGRPCASKYLRRY